MGGMEAQNMTTQAALDAAFGAGATQVLPDPEPSHGRITDPQKLAAFLLGGNATMTLISVRTGTRFTYKVQAPKENRGRPVHFVKLLSGPHNEFDYTYMGAIFDGMGFSLTKASKMGPTAPAVRAFGYAWDKIRTGQAPEGVEFWHVGRCGVCGRTLTVQSSISAGIGPECAAKGGM